MDTKPQAIASLLLYLQQSIIRKVCKALFESILNHILTTKHLKITVGEYTYGLPRFLLGDVTGQWYTTYQIQNVKKDGFFYSIKIIFEAVLIKIISQWLALSCMTY